MDEKGLLTLAGTIVGWALGQGTTVFKDLRNTRKLKQGLIQELEDIKDQLGRVQLIYRRNIQIYIQNGLTSSAPLPIHNTYFKQYYKDVMSSLNRNQRISYQLIHASVDNLNERGKDFHKSCDATCKELRASEDRTEIMQAVQIFSDETIALYQSTMDLAWHIEYHLQNKKNPALDVLVPMHESYVKFQVELDEDIKKIIAGAKSIKREDLMKIYDETAFRSPN